MSEETNLLMCPNCSLTHIDLTVKSRDKDGNPLCESCNSIMETIVDGEDFGKKLASYLEHRDERAIKRALGGSW